MELQGIWGRFKLDEVLNDPSFLGKTVRLGDKIFEVKGVKNSALIRSS